MWWNDEKHNNRSANSNKNSNRSGARKIKSGPRKIGTRKTKGGSRKFESGTETYSDEHDSRVAIDAFAKGIEPKQYRTEGIESKQYSTKYIGSGQNKWSNICSGFKIDSDSGSDFKIDSDFGSGSDSDESNEFKNFYDKVSGRQGTVTKFEFMAKWIGFEQYITEYVKICICSGIDIDTGSELDSDHFIGFKNNKKKVSSWQGTTRKVELVHKWIGSDHYSTEWICRDKNSENWFWSKMYDVEYSSQ
jgi:hypothetical protein